MHTYIHKKELSRFVLGTFTSLLLLYEYFVDTVMSQISTFKFRLYSINPIII